MKINNFSLASAFLAFTLVISFLPITPLTFSAEAISPTIFSDSFGTTPDGNNVTGWTETENNPSRIKISVAAPSQRAGSPTIGHVLFSGSNSSPALVIEKEIDLAGYENIVLKYFYRGDSNAEDSSGGVDWLKVYWKKSSDAEYTLLNTHQNLDALGDNWSSEISTNIPDASDSLIKIKFELNITAADEIIAIDDVSITGNEIVIEPEITYETIEVNPLDMKGWEFNSDRAAWSMGIGAMISGPDTAPLGLGSARLTTPTNDERTKLRKYLTPGTQISDIFELEYSTYRSEPTGGVLAPALQFDIDFDGTPVDPTKADGRIVFEPYYTYTTQDDAWQTWNALADNGTGNWWIAGPNGGSSCTIGNPCTWTELNTAYPDMRISAKSLENIDTAGAVLFKAGGGWAGFDGNVDKLVLGIGTHVTTYDFEPYIDPCTYQNEVFYSDETMIVDGNPAALAWTHEAWVSTSSPAKWVWSSYNVQNPTEDELKSFKRTFTMTGNPVASSTLSIAVDNSYKVLVNGTEVASTTTESNFGAFTNIEIAPNLLLMGENTIEVIVHNWKPDDFEGTAESNPAGFIFALYASTKACPGDEPYVPTPETLQVKIYKYLDGAQATVETANSYDFPMNATWSWTGNNGSGNYVLNESGHGGSPAYAAFTSVMTAPAMYQTYEITNNIDANSNVLPIGATCEPGKYRLLGYRTGDTFGQAQNATLSPNYPNYQSLYDDKYVIVENEACPLPEQLASVTICKWTNGDQSLPDWTLYLTKGSKIEYLPVSSTNWNGANTLSVLDSSKSYFAIASSTWANQGGANMVDPEYSTTDNWVSNIMDGYTGYGTGILELQIQNTDGFWGPYASSTHTYAQAFTPVSTGSVNFRVFDGTDGNQNQGWFGDNSGSLGVDIYEGYAGVTGENGCVTFTDVPYGTYNVGEIMQTGWQNDSGLGEVVVDSSEEIFNVTNSEIVVDDQDDELVCSEGFEPNEAGTDCVATENDDDGENGATYACSDGLDNDADQATDYPADTGCASVTDDDETNEIVMQLTSTEPPQSLSGGRRRGGMTGGEVLGASTGPSCGIYLNSYIKPGANNDQSEVVKLQEFLNKYMGANIPTTGFYGPISQSWVKIFQEMFASEILAPWQAIGHGGEGTAHVYKTTKRWINIMVCPELISELPMPPLP